MVECLHMRLCHVRIEQFQNNSWLLLDDNMPNHCVLNIKEFLASKLICVIQHPLYSLDMALTDLLLFPKLKLVLQGERLSDISDIQCGVTGKLKGVSLQAFQCRFVDLYKLSQHCVELGGGCIERV
jgi:hypothetical protein